LRCKRPSELILEFCLAKTKIAKLHKANANKRNDYLHKISRSIVKEYDLIGLENLNVKGMMGNHKLARVI